MTRTGVFATKEEIEDMQSPVPYMVMGTIKREDGSGYDPVLPRSPQEKCHFYALRHGLTEIDGYYGCDLETGEFVSI